VTRRPKVHVAMKFLYYTATQHYILLLYEAVWGYRLYRKRVWDS